MPPSEARAVAATLKEIGVSGTGGGHEGDGDASAMRGTSGGGGTASGAALMAVLPRWPPAVGYRLYSCLLEAIFETDEPAVLASDCDDVLELLRGLWYPCDIDESRHTLALLSIAFDHYQQSGAPQRGCWSC